MDTMEWIRQEEQDLLAHIEDSIRTGELDMTYGYCSKSFLGGRPVTTLGLQVGDTVKIVGQFFTGKVGELQVIDEGNLPHGVYLDAAERVVFFPVDELKRMERALDSYSADELKDYLRGLYAIPLREITGNDRDQMRECKRLLKAMGWEFVFKGGSNIAFRKIRTEWKKWK